MNQAENSLYNVLNDDQGSHAQQHPTKGPLDGVGFHPVRHPPLATATIIDDLLCYDEFSGSAQLRLAACSFKSFELKARLTLALDPL